MPKFIKLSPKNEKIKDFYVNADRIVYFSGGKAEEGTALVFSDGRSELVKESTESVLNLLKSSNKPEDAT